MIWVRPPPPIASAGRLNRPGVSFLYVGSSHKTAISEIRPHPGHLVSLGQFDTVRDLTVLDFSKPTFLDFPLNDVGLEQFELTLSIDRDLSRPITPEQRAAYISAQFVADLVRQCGFDGVLYRSSVSDGTNLCVFDPRTLKFAPGSASLFRTRSVHYEYEELTPSGQRRR
ncbi:RES family NAD+ phosphorylase [Paenirhodobacter populi]|uniref:RES family NAD+ phosphorylase n=1 Tax=Paenirhodobacter populi TaxID=2306993 RepID=UPI0037433DCB